MKVVGVEARDSGLEFTKTLGAQVILDARKGKESVVKELEKEAGRLCKASIIFSDHPTALPIGAAITAIHGTVVQIALTPTLNIGFQEFIFRDIKLIGSLLGNSLELEELLQFVSKNKIRIAVTEFNGLKEMPKLMEKARSGEYP